MSPGSGTGFQSFVNNELPPGVAGDFAGANIRANVVAGPNGFVAAPGGVNIGVGCWANPATGIASNYYQPSSFPGFVHRAGQALITEFLGIASAKIQPGDEVTAMDQGDFWGIFVSGATPGQKVYFDGVTGALTAGAPGGSVVASASNGSSIAANVLTTTDADVTGVIAAGQAVSGVGIPPGTYIASADGTGSGTHLWTLANADGTAIPNIAGPIATNFGGIQETQFYVASPVTVDADVTASLAAAVAPSPFGVLTVTVIGSGVLAPGQFLSAAAGGGLAAGLNIQIIEQLTGSAGGTGTYLTNNQSSVVTSTAFVATQGKLGKISSWTTS